MVAADSSTSPTVNLKLFSRDYPGPSAMRVMLACGLEAAGLEIEGGCH
jgi:hypothetical protein